MIKPKILKIEVTNRCNGRCIFCSHKFLAKRLIDMPLETVKKLLNEASTWKPKVQFSGISEPTLYPYLVEAVKYCHGKGMISCFNTNGMLMTPNLTRELVKAGLSEFLLAIDGRDREIYEKIRVGLNFETVKYNIQEAWKICRSSKTKMHLLHVKCRENQHDIRDIEKYWRSYAHKSHISSEIPLTLGHPDADKGRVLPQHNKVCDRPWTQLIIRANGNIPLCCVDLTDKYIMGNIYKNSMLEIFNSKKFDKLKQRIKKGYIPELCKHVCVRNA